MLKKKVSSSLTLKSRAQFFKFFLLGIVKLNHSIRVSFVFDNLIVLVNFLECILA